MSRLHRYLEKSLISLASLVTVTEQYRITETKRHIILQYFQFNEPLQVVIPHLSFTRISNKHKNEAKFRNIYYLPKR